ncbi:MAG: outer membrane lipoprotein-sorting protein [Opitutales bacterium]
MKSSLFKVSMPCRFGTLFIVATALAVLQTLVLATEEQDWEGDENLPAYEELLKNHLDANGGRRNIHAIRSIKISGQMRIAAREEPVSFKVYRKRPDKLRQKLEFGNYTVETIYNGGEAWRKIQGKWNDKQETQELKEEDELGELKNAARMESEFLQLATQKIESESISREVVREEPCYRLEFSADSLEDTDFSSYHTIWLSADHFQVVKLRGRVRSEESGEFVIKEVYYSEYSQKEGVYFPQKAEIYHDGEMYQTLHIESLRINAGIFDSFFEKN